MRHAIRTQCDKSFKTYSKATRLDASKGDKTRQEDKSKCDINRIIAALSRGEHIEQRPRALTDVVDYDVDLTTSLHMTEEAHNAYYRLPAHIRQRYPTWLALVTGIGNGDKINIKPPTPAVKVADPPQPKPPAASDSALANNTSPPPPKP